MNQPGRLRIAHVMIITACVALAVSTVRLLTEESTNSPLWMPWAIAYGLGIAFIPIAWLLRREGVRFPENAGDWLWIERGLGSILTIGYLLAFGPEHNEYRWIVSLIGVIFWMIPIAVLRDRAMTRFCVIASAGSWQVLFYFVRGTRPDDFLLSLVGLGLVGLGLVWIPRFRRPVLYGVLSFVLGIAIVIGGYSWFGFGGEGYMYLVVQSVCAGMVLLLLRDAYRRRSGLLWSSWAGLGLEVGTRLLSVFMMIRVLFLRDE